MANTRRRAARPAPVNSLFDPSVAYGDQAALKAAEGELLEIADYIYGHTSLKPISKTLFMLSRCLCVAKLRGEVRNADDLVRHYQDIRSSMNGSGFADDFDFAAVVNECEKHVPRILKSVNEVCSLTDRTDSLGLAFNTLLRGKFEGGEGLGTFLTPEEVVYPMVDMLLHLVDSSRLNAGRKPLLFGDICGGTGRFVFAIARRLQESGHDIRRLERSARLFDQSSLAVDLGKLNFLFDGMTPAFSRVDDSLTAESVTELRERFLLLATNPPFGAGKYRWHPAIEQVLPHEVLAELNFTQSGHTADPSELFFFRNLDLLAPGGALAIVLPDGVLHSRDFKRSLEAYEAAKRIQIHLAAVVSLPAVTFTLGGTVAKTSFVVAQRKDGDFPLYAAEAKNVGFLKRGKRRVDDPNGNDLKDIARESASASPRAGKLVTCWRTQSSLAPAALLHAATASKPTATIRLSELAQLPREYQRSNEQSLSAFHISILDVDETGLIDIVAAKNNRPVTKGLTCEPGDVLVSCMNPKIWRATIVPDLHGEWSCSPEFAVIRAKKGVDSARLALALHNPDVVKSVQSMATGTSSSRQRVPKTRILEVEIPSIETDETLREYVRWREDYYRRRLREAELFARLHAGETSFRWKPGS